MAKIYYHADDFGYTKGITDHIAETINNGLISSVSIMPNGTYLKKSKRIIKKKNIKTFIHLNLTEGTSITKNKTIKKYLLDKKGNFKHNFFNLNFFWLLSSKKKREKINYAIYEEIKAQIKIAKCSKKILLDGHQHIHISPIVFKQILRLNKKQKITQLRLPIDYFFLKLNFFLKKNFYLNLIKYYLLLFLSKIYKKKLIKAKIKFDDFCFGIIHSGFISKELIEILKQKTKNKKYSIQILLHPGYSSKNDKKNFKTLKNWNYYNSKNRIKEFNLVKKIK
jgi:predicted glycoside hydrolase/deacetylase ChbG (UPF0249 family)